MKNTRFFFLLTAFLRLSGAVLFWGVLLPACTSRTSIDVSRTIQVQLKSEPVSLDPVLAEDGVSMRILSNVMDGLVGYDGAGKLENRLAESYRISPDGKRYEFTLRPAKWSDGRVVEAQDFVVGFRRALSPQMASKLANLLYPIRGAKAYHSGKLDALSLGVASQGSLLTIELESPAPYFLEALTLMIALPAREDFLQAHQGKWTREAPVTGPYRMASHKIDREILLEPNPNYWNAKVKALPVLIRIVTDEATALNLFEQGKLDIVSSFPSFDLKRMHAKGVVRVDPYAATYFISFNTRTEPFRDRDFRRAVAASIRREEITQALGSGETPAWSWIPMGIEGFVPYRDPRPALQDSVAKVRARLAARPTSSTSVVGSEKGAPIEASFDTSGRNSMVMEKIQSDLLRELGMRVSLKNLDWKSHLGSLGAGPAPIYRFGWLSPFNDPITQMQAFTTGNPNNYSGWSNSEYDRLVEEIAALAPGPRRLAKLVRAQEILVEVEAAAVPLYHYVQTHAVAARVQNFAVAPNGNVRFCEIRLK